MRPNTSPHDYWALMGLEDYPAPRVDPDPPEAEPAICGELEPWGVMSEIYSLSDGTPVFRRTRTALGPDELEFMGFIGE